MLQRQLSSAAAAAASVVVDGSRNDADWNQPIRRVGDSSPSAYHRHCHLKHICRKTMEKNVIIIIIILKLFITIIT